jgi:hypothetical protein
MRKRAQPQAAAAACTIATVASGRQRLYWRGGGLRERGQLLQCARGQRGNRVRVRTEVGVGATLTPPLILTLTLTPILTPNPNQVRSDQGGLFHKKMQGWLQQRFPRSHVTHFNAAMPAVPPSYMQHCLRLHVPQDADLIFLEVFTAVESNQPPRGFVK